MSIPFESIINHISETYIEGCKDKDCFYCNEYLEILKKYKFNLLVKRWDYDD